MPACHITLSEKLPDLTFENIEIIRDIVAEGLDSGARRLDRNHIVVRVNRAQRKSMLGEIEIEVFSQLFVRRFFSRDRRAKNISQKITEKLGFDCATWINMCIVGYSRVTKTGEVFFSD